MATAIAEVAVVSQRRTVSVIRLLTTGAITALLAFVLCWLGTFMAFPSPTHAFITLFTTAPVNSVAALTEGGLWSLLFGGLVGALFGIVYNVTAALDR